MGRHKKSIERPMLPDVKYNSKVVSKFVCRMMLDGKKSICTKIVYEAMDNLKAKTDKDPLEVLLKALENVKPMVEVKSRRVGGATYQDGSSMQLVQEADTEWQIHLLLNFLMLTTIQVLLTRIVKMYIRWLKLTRLLLTTDGSLITAFYIKREITSGNSRFFYA